MLRHFFRGFAYSAIALTAIALTDVPASASQAIQRFNQPEQRDAYGRLTVEASVITVVSCNGPGENGGQFYIYQYVNRPGFRAVRPPYWGQAIGGRDFASYEQANYAACGGGVTSVPTGGSLTGTYRLTTSCTWTNPAWSALVNLYQGPGGSLTATTSDDKLSTSWTGPTPAPESMGSNMKSQVSGSTFNLLLHPKGWVSVLEFTGTVNGSRIDGRIHHYNTDDCNFTMIRQYSSTDE